MMKDYIRPYAWVILRLPSDISKLQQIEPNTYVMAVVSALNTPYMSNWRC